MKNRFLIISLLVLSLQSCAEDVSKCNHDLIEKPFLTTVKVEYDNRDKTYTHFIMLNGCSNNSEGYLFNVLEKYIDTTAKKPIKEFDLMFYKEGGYKEEFAANYSTIWESVFLELQIDARNQKDTIIVKSVFNRVDGNSFSIRYP